MRRIVLAVVAVVAMSFGLAACDGCSNPYECGPDDIDGDGDGRCNEG